MGKALASTLAEVMPRTKFGGGQCSRRCLFCFNSGNFPQKKIRKLTVRSRKLEFRFRFWNYGHHIQRSLVLHLLALVFIFVGVYVRYNVLSFLKIITKGTICRRHRRSSGERWHQQWQSINDDDLFFHPRRCQRRCTCIVVVIDVCSAQLPVVDVNIWGQLQYRFSSLTWWKKGQEQFSTKKWKIYCRNRNRN